MIAEIQTFTKTNSKNALDVVPTSPEKAPKKAEQPKTFAEKCRAFWNNPDRRYGMKWAFIIFIYYAVNIFVWYLLEGFSIVEGIYFVTASLTTVGYGDLSAGNDGSRIYAIFFLIIGLGLLSTKLSEYANWSLEQIMKDLREKKKENNSSGFKDSHRSLLNMSHKSACDSAENAEKIDDAMDVEIDEAKLENQQNRRNKVYFSILLMVACVFCGMATIILTENVSVATGIYWALVTTLTVGYGDVPITSDVGKLISCVYMLVSTLCAAVAIGNLSEVSLEVSLERKKEQILKNMTLRELLDGLDGADASVDKVEFLSFMLCKLNDLDREDDILPILAKFDDLDYDNSGTLCRNDLVAYEERIQGRKEKYLSSQNTPTGGFGSVFSSAAQKLINVKGNNEAKINNTRVAPISDVDTQSQAEAEADKV